MRIITFEAIINGIIIIDRTTAFVYNSPSLSLSLSFSFSRYHTITGHDTGMKRPYKRGRDEFNDEIIPTA